MTKLTKAYIAVMSNRDNIKFDQDELDKVAMGMKKGAGIWVRRGYINPSFVVNIVLDVDRMRDYANECNYGGEQGDRARTNGMKPLKTIFGGTELGRQLLEAEAARRAELPGGTSVPHPSTVPAA